MVCDRASRSSCPPASRPPSSAAAATVCRKVRQARLRASSCSHLHHHAGLMVTFAAMGANVTIKPAWWWRWLHDDARNRAWRTFLHTVAAAALLGGLDAGGQLLRDALSQTMAGQAVDWRQVGATMGVGALMALLTPALAYAHRVELDPSPLPSAAPPPPPEWPAAGT